MWYPPSEAAPHIEHGTLSAIGLLPSFVPSILQCRNGGAPGSFKRSLDISARLLVALPAEMREIIAGRRDYRVSPSGVSWAVKQLRRFINERPRTIKVEAVVSVGTVDGPQLNESEAESALPVVVVEGLAIGIPRATCNCVLPNAATGVAIEVRHDAHVATVAAH